MGTRKYFECTACEQKHEKPINEDCPFVDTNQEDDSSDSGSDIPLAQQPQDSDSDSNQSKESDEGTKHFLAKLLA